MRLRIACLALVLALATLPLAAQPVSVVPADGTAAALDPAQVRQLPAAEQTVGFLTGHGREEARYAGTLLWTVLQRDGKLEDDPRARLRHSVLVTGRDGYTALLALAEIDPEFENKPVLLAWRKDGKSLEDGLRLVVPGDRRGGRSVRDVVRIEIR